MVDDQDFGFLNSFKWRIIPFSKNSQGGYAITNVPTCDNKQGTFYMHRLILLATNPKIEVDHVDGNRLNNQRSNLRICSRQKNSFNSKIKSTNTSGFKGVSWCKKTNKWRARIFVKGKEHIAGYFLKKEDAAKAYNKMASKFFKEFARINALTYE